MRHLAMLSLVALFAGKSWASDDVSIPKKSADKISALIQEYFAELDGDSYRKAEKQLDKIRKEVEAVEKKIENPLRLVGDWREILKEGGLLPKPPVRVSANGKFGRGPVEIPCPLPWRPEAKDAEKAFDGMLKAFMSVPKDYKKVAYPVLLALHPQEDESGKELKDFQASGDMVTAVQEWLTATYPEDLLSQAIVVAPIFDYVVLSPTGDSGSRVAWSEFQGAAWAVTALRALVFQTLNYDAARIFIDGHGSGGTAAVSLCAQFPSLQTGAIVRGPTPGAVEFSNCQSSHVLFVGEETKEFHDGWAGEGFPIQHVSDLTTDSLMEFVNKAEKEFCPEKVQIQALDARFGSAYWLQITVFDHTLEGNEPAHILGEVNREKNEITVVTNPKVKGFTIYLNDVLLDLDKEIRILHRTEGGDGSAQEELTVRFAGTRARGLEDALQLTYQGANGNPGEMYVATIKVDL